MTTLLPEDSNAPGNGDGPGHPPTAEEYQELWRQLNAERTDFAARDRARSTWMVVAVIVAGIALVGSAIAWGFAQHADSHRGAAVAAAAGGRTVEVDLSEFKIAPAMVMGSVGDTLKVVNKGTMAHQLTVQGTQLATAQIPPGGSATLNTSGLTPGNFTIYCNVPGHQGLGMQAMLMLSEGTGSSSASGPTGAAGAAGATGATGATAGLTAEMIADGMTMPPAAMDQAMKSSTTAFPAKTAGVGAQLLAPTVLADGTKQFDLTAEVVDWEVSPGKTVKAWTYNGTVPGPTIMVNPGDKVQVVLHNHLPEATTVHFHGITGPQNIDGTPYVSQDPVEPGQTYTYAWTVSKTPEIGMYHSHFDAVSQVPDGMAGAFLVGTMALPAQATAQGAVQSAVQDQVLFLNDGGTIGLTLNGKSFPATAPFVATQGQWIEVTYFNEGQMIHPMHLHEIPQMIIARDGFPLANPEMDDTVLVAPGQRVTVLVHATDVGTWVWHCHILSHAEGPQGMFGMVTALVVKPAA
ncbi:MAG TPA: multicopper oxidase domain-containing protein [Acidimicrobiales bacterium]|nr:multicopper oxidase domain-containing protein [Acidimicrobiales bacterium]